MKTEKYYIYYHIDPRDGMPKYVGKGSGKRAWEFGKTKRNTKHFNWIGCLLKNGMEPIVFIGNRYNSEEECFNSEIKDIAILRKIGIDLKNISLGGNGVKLTPEMIKNRSNKIKKPIICLNNGKKYNSSKDCSEELRLDPRRINDVLKSRKNSYKGYRFRYLEEKLNTIPDQIRKSKEKRVKHTNGYTVLCICDGNVYNSMEEACRNIGINSSYMCTLFKKNKEITIKGKKYKREV